MLSFCIKSFKMTSRKNTTKKNIKATENIDIMEEFHSDR